jgi:pimeloyl-ACP methyl ester carboxylesterase
VIARDNVSHRRPTSQCIVGGDSQSALARTPFVQTRSPYTLRSAGQEIRRADLGTRLRLINARMFVVWGEQNRWLPLDCERRVTASAGAEMQIVPAAGRHPMREHPDLFNAIAVDFLTNASWPRP